jgi:hypothetical protein
MNGTLEYDQVLTKESGDAALVSIALVKKGRIEEVNAVEVVVEERSAILREYHFIWAEIRQVNQ